MFDAMARLELRLLEGLDRRQVLDLLHERQSCLPPALTADWLDGQPTTRLRLLLLAAKVIDLVGPPYRPPAPPGFGLPDTGAVRPCDHAGRARAPLAGLLEHCRWQAADRDRAAARLRRPVCSAAALPYWRARAAAHQALACRWHDWAEALEQVMQGQPHFARSALTALLAHVRQQGRRMRTVAAIRRPATDVGKWTAWAQALETLLGADHEAVAPDP